MYSRGLIKPEAYRDREYITFLHEWPCTVCGSRREIQAAHTGAHGLATKSSDIRALPLCRNHHLGPEGLDVIGPEKFEAKYNVNLREECLVLINAFLTTGHALVAMP